MTLRIDIGNEKGCHRSFGAGRFILHPSSFILLAKEPA